MKPSGTHLLVGTTGDYAPFSYSAGGRRVGLDIDLAEALTARLGFAFSWSSVAWASFGQAFATATVDLIISGVTITSERRSTGGFTRPYLHNKTVIMARNGEPGLDPRLLLGAGALHGRKLGVNRGGYLEAVARTRFPEAVLIQVADNTKLPAQLLSGDFALFMSDRVEAERFRAAYPVQVVADLETQQHAIYFPPSREALRLAFDAALTSALADGTVATLAKKHGIDPGLLPGGTLLERSSHP